MTSNDQLKNYAGDLSVADAWALLESDPRAQLVDVRTTAEWNFVGRCPTFRAWGARCCRWSGSPSRRCGPIRTSSPILMRNGASAKDAPVLFLCRSGARSRSAAIAMTAAGYARAYNIADGFEGDLDGERHRGKQNGWKASGLPWKQS